MSIPLCHCSTCRHSTGLLCTSYMPIAAPVPSALGKTTAYPARPSCPSPARASDSDVRRYFCSTCGCHVFRSKPVRDVGTAESQDSRGDREAHDERAWEVATGVLSNVADYVRIERHANIQDTRDGGLSIWITEQNHHPFSSAPPGPAPPHTEAERRPLAAGPSPPTTPTASDKTSDSDQDNILHAHCACGRVAFHLTRPHPALSVLPHSPFPDLMIPYHTRDPRIPNTASGGDGDGDGDAKWWLRAPTLALPAGSKYLAGTCACRSCRLTSGFEVQTWAFVPRANIVLHDVPALTAGGAAGAGAGAGAGDPEAMPWGRGTEGHETRGCWALDFDALRERERAGSALLRAYESSEGVVREFCPGCGASVFWHDRWRPELVDVSVGLLDAGEGARAEGWLEWWVGRVSFQEEAGRDGDGGGGADGWDLIPALGRGLKAWGEEMKARGCGAGA